MNKLLATYRQHFIKEVTIAPLVTFRILWGFLMLVSVIRFAANGWIKDLYIDPTFYFSFIEGLQPLPGWGMYIVFAFMGLAALGVMLGWFYRISTEVFFLLFTYVELLDKTNYLNHYYFVSLVSFIMMFLPAHRAFSLDVTRKRVGQVEKVPVGFVNILKLQLGIVYFFAGVAKVSGDWLLRAQPLSLWLSSRVHMPVVGELFRYKITAFVFSWFGMLYDLCIPFLLVIRKTLPFAYLAVVGFHLATWMLFPIGMFPFIMIAATTIFFPASWHVWILERLKAVFRKTETSVKSSFPLRFPRFQLTFFILFFVIQMVIPLRHYAYPGDLFWNESGFRFSWRVMLMEKAGHITFYIKEGNKRHMVANYNYLTPQQEKMMATQPDMIVQFAEYLEKEFQQKGFQNPEVIAESRVSLNGRPNRIFVDPQVDLTSSVVKMDRTKWIVQYD